MAEDENKSREVVLKAFAFLNSNDARIKYASIHLMGNVTHELVCQIISLNEIINTDDDVLINDIKELQRLSFSLFHISFYGNLILNINNIKTRSNEVVDVALERMRVSYFFFGSTVEIGAA